MLYHITHRDTRARVFLNNTHHVYMVGFGREIFALAYFE